MIIACLTPPAFAVAGGQAKNTAAAGAGRDSTERALDRPARERSDTGHTMKDPDNLVRKVAFSVRRGADGRCDWLSVGPRMEKHLLGESIYIGEKHERTCQGEFFLVTILKPESRLSTTTSISFPSHIWEGRDTLSGRGREARDIVNAVLAVAPKSVRLEQMTITDDSLAYVTELTGRSPRHYSLRLRNGKWVLAGNRGNRSR